MTEKMELVGSPFPGMDPYLEATDTWPDFHDALANEIRVELNKVLPVPYYARLQKRSELGLVRKGGTLHRIVPDLSALPTELCTSLPLPGKLDRPQHIRCCLAWRQHRASTSGFTRISSNTISSRFAVPGATIGW